MYANLPNQGTEQEDRHWERTRRKTVEDKRVESKKKKKTSERKDLKFRNGTREGEQREKTPIKKMIHSETKYSFILKD